MINRFNQFNKFGLGKDSRKIASRSRAKGTQVRQIPKEASILASSQPDKVRRRPRTPTRMAEWKNSGGAKRSFPRVRKHRCGLNVARGEAARVGWSDGGNQPHSLYGRARCGWVRAREKDNAAAHARHQPPERPTRDLDGVRIGWEREEGRREGEGGTYTLVSQGSRSSFVVPSQRRRPLLIKLFCATGRYKKGRKDRETIPTTIVRYYIVRFNDTHKTGVFRSLQYYIGRVSRCRCSLVPAVQSGGAGGQTRGAGGRKAEEATRRSSSSFSSSPSSCTGSVSGRRSKLELSFFLRFLRIWYTIYNRRNQVLRAKLVLEECFGGEIHRQEGGIFSTSRVLQGDLSDTVVLIAVY